MIEQSETLSALATALAKTQGAIEGAVKDRTNPAFRSKYADLSNVWEAFQKVGPANGLSVVQVPGRYDPDAKTMAMSIMLLHSSGEWIGGEMSVPLTKIDAQGYGSACTYARRYSLSALIGICPEDDDGNAAVRHALANEPNISEDQVNELRTIAEMAGADLRAFCQYLKVSALGEIKASAFANAKAALEAKLNKKA